ncbi:MAG: hypothetical protein JSV03_09295 [Planctomycetota bacterium]|nr:MAG: hypothetical protein JSV03_09295 [Planctomycetota bacterium]
MQISIVKLVVISVAVFLFSVGMAGAAPIATQDFEDNTVDASISGQGGGTGWKPGDLWLASDLGSTGRTWWVEKPATNTYMRSLGTGSPYAYRTFAASDTLTETWLYCKFDIAVQDSMAADFQFRILADEVYEGAAMRVRVKFAAAGEIVSIGTTGGIKNPTIGYWNGTGGYADCTNNFVTMELYMNRDTYTYVIVWDGEYLGTYNWYTSTNANLTDINLLGGTSGSVDPAVAGGVMLDNLYVEEGVEPPPPPACSSEVLPMVKQYLGPAPVGGSIEDSTDYVINNNGSANISQFTVAEVDQNGDPQEYTWLTVAPLTGGPILAGENSGPITATANSTGLDVGVYNAYLKFTDDCTTGGHIREIEYTILPIDVDPPQKNWSVTSPWYAAIRARNCPSGDQYVFTVTNNDDVPQTYTALEVNGDDEPFSPADWVEIEIDAGHDGVPITLNPGESDTLTVTITEDAITSIAGSADDVYIGFQTDMGWLVRTIRIYDYTTDTPTVYYYDGARSPDSADSFGTGYTFALYSEADNIKQGSVVGDSAAHDGRAWKIVDDDTHKSKWYNFPSVNIAPPIGATILARVKVESASGNPGANLSMYDGGGLTAGYHFGGPDQGRVKEIERGNEDIDAGRADSNYHTIRLVAVGGEDGAGYPQKISLYFDENPTPVVDIPAASLVKVVPPEDAFGFGATDIAGTQTISFDWIMATRTGAFAPGDELTCIGQVLEPPPPPCNIPFADADNDGDVDQDDFAEFQLCYTGATVGVPEGCECFERDGDDKIDQVDWFAFEECASGPNIPVTPESNPNCGN